MSRSRLTITLSKTPNNAFNTDVQKQSEAALLHAG